MEKPNLDPEICFVFLAFENWWTAPEIWNYTEYSVGHIRTRAFFFLITQLCIYYFAQNHFPGQLLLIVNSLPVKISFSWFLFIALIFQFSDPCFQLHQLLQIHLEDLWTRGAVTRSYSYSNNSEFICNKQNLRKGLCLGIIIDGKTKYETWAKTGIYHHECWTECSFCIKWHAHSF